MARRDIGRFMAFDVAYYDGTGGLEVGLWAGWLTAACLAPGPVSYSTCLRDQIPAVGILFGDQYCSRAGPAFQECPCFQLFFLGPLPKSAIGLGPHEIGWALSTKS